MIKTFKEKRLLKQLKTTLNNDLIQLQRDYSRESEFTFPHTSQLDNIMLFEIGTHNLNNENDINTISDFNVVINLTDILSYYDDKKTHILQNYPIWIDPVDMTFAHTRKFILNTRKSLKHIDETINKLKLILIKEEII